MRLQGTDLKQVFLSAGKVYLWYYSFLKAHDKIGVAVNTESSYLFCMKA